MAAFLGAAGLLVSVVLLVRYYGFGSRTYGELRGGFRSGRLFRLNIGTYCCSCRGRQSSRSLSSGQFREVEDSRLNPPQRNTMGQSYVEAATHRHRKAVIGTAGAMSYGTSATTLTVRRFHQGVRVVRIVYAEEPFRKRCVARAAIGDVGTKQIGIGTRRHVDLSVRLSLQSIGMSAMETRKPGKEPCCFIGQRLPHR